MRTGLGAASPWDVACVGHVLEGCGRHEAEHVVSAFSRSLHRANTRLPVSVRGPVKLLRDIEVLEDCLDHPARNNYVPMQPGEVPFTRADVDDLVRECGSRPRTTVEDGIGRRVESCRADCRID